MDDKKYNKGEWSEPYVAIRVLGDKKLYAADEKGEKDLNQWMEVLELIRHETKERVVKYRCSDSDVDVNIEVDGKPILSVSAAEFFIIADKLKEEILSASGGTFSLSKTVTDFLQKICLLNIKAKSINKSDTIRNSPIALIMITNILKLVFIIIKVLCCKIIESNQRKIFSL